MADFRKMALIPTDQVQPNPRAIDRQLTRLDAEMKRVLNADIPEDLKFKLYMHVLQQYNILAVDRDKPPKFEIVSSPATLTHQLPTNVSIPPVGVNLLPMNHPPGGPNQGGFTHPRAGSVTIPPTQMFQSVSAVPQRTHSATPYTSFPPHTLADGVGEEVDGNITDTPAVDRVGRPNRRIYPPDAPRKPSVSHSPKANFTPPDFSAASTPSSHNTFLSPAARLATSGKIDPKHLFKAEKFCEYLAESDLTFTPTGTLVQSGGKPLVGSNYDALVAYAQSTPSTRSRTKPKGWGKFEKGLKRIKMPREFVVNELVDLTPPKRSITTRNTQGGHGRVRWEKF